MTRTPYRTLTLALVTAFLATPLVGAGGLPPTPCPPDLALVLECHAPAWTATRAEARYGDASVAVDPAGRTTFVTASEEDDLMVLAFDAATGEEAWRSRVLDHSTRARAASPLVVTPDGESLLVLAERERADGGRDPTLISIYTDTGAVRWIRTLATAEGALAWARHLAVTPEGGSILVAAQAGEDVAVLSLERHFGGLEWSVTVDGPAGGWDYPAGIALSGDGATAFLAAGMDHGRPRWRDTAIVAVDVDAGAHLWTTARDFGGVDWARAITASADGSRVVAVGTGGVLAVDALTGNEVWSSGQPAGASELVAVAAIPGTTRVVATGWGSGYVTAAWDVTTGMLAWQDLYMGPAMACSYATALAVTPDGSRVIVTGYSFGASVSEDFLTIALDAATGTRSWIARHDGGGSDYFPAITVSSDGSHAFLAGSTLTRTGETLSLLAYPV